MVASEETSVGAAANVPVLNLATAPGERAAWSRPRSQIYLWDIAERLLVTNSWQISSRLRIAVLRKFGAKIGTNVTFRPRTRVTFPWNLTVGDNCWIGEGVWIHNQNHVSVGNDVVLSQETFITTGSHAHRRDMGLITRPVYIEDGAWITSRCVVLGGASVGRSAVVGPLTVVSGRIEANTVVQSPASAGQTSRFSDITVDKLTPYVSVTGDPSH